MIPILARFWPYIVIVLGGLALWGLHTIDKARYGALQTEYANYRTAVAEANGKAQEAARAAVEQQIRDRVRTDKHNAEILRDYETTNAAIAADRDRSRELARRLLAAGQGGRSSPSRSVPEAADRPAAPDPGEAGSDVEAGELLTDASAECRANASQLNALIAELKPQL